jgi:bifunctional isochorismate lyase/aryl carrier protein
VNREQMRHEVAEQMGLEPPEVADDDNLIALGMESIAIMTLVNRWRRLGLDVSFTELVEHPTFAGWWAHVSALTAAPLS